jgi:sterigmatocystin biosynthesis cytochrome P450 monooxygenase
MITSPAGILLAASVLAAVAVGVAKLVRVRMKYRTGKIPCPPHNFLLGHLPLLARMQMSVAARAHPHLFMHEIQKRYNLPPVFYLDVWPMSLGMMVILDPDIAQQVTVEHSLLKSGILRPYMVPMVGENGLIIMEKQEWKQWRAIFNPGFSAGHLMSLIPDMVEEIAIFNQVLGKIADTNSLCRLEELATKLTFDIIGIVSL